MCAPTAFRDTDDDSPANAGRETWISFFLGAVLPACDQAERTSAEVAELRTEWEDSLAQWATRENGDRPLRKDSAAARILAGLPGTPVLTVTTGRDLGLSCTAAVRRLEVLKDAGILTTEAFGAGQRAYKAPSVLDTITWVERRLASTRFDTRDSAPVRPVPARPVRRSGTVRDGPGPPDSRAVRPERPWAPLAALGTSPSPRPKTPRPASLFTCGSHDDAGNLASGATPLWCGDHGVDVVEVLPHVQGGFHPRLHEFVVEQHIVG